MKFRGLRGAAPLLTVCCILFAAHTVHSQVAPRPTDGIPIPDRSVTTQADAASIEVNPAGLGFLESTELRYGLDLSNFGDTLRDQHGVYMGAGTSFIAAGAGIQWLDRSINGAAPSRYQKYSLGLALRPSDAFSFGAGLHIFGSPTSRQLDGTTSLDIGTQLRVSRHMALGLAMRDVNQPFLTAGDGESMRLIPGAAIRLLGDRVEVDTDFAWTVGEGELAWRPRIKVRPVEGLGLFARAAVPIVGPDAGAVGPEFVLTSGLALSLGRTGLDAGATVRGGSSDGETFAGLTQQVWFNSRRHGSLLAPAGRWVRIDLNGNIAERATSGLLVANRRSFLDLLLGLDEVSRSRRVDGVVLQVGNTSLGWAQAWELRRAVDRLRDRGKKVVAFMSRSSFKATYIATAAQRVVMLPSHPFEPAGLSSTKITYADALARVGIEAEFLRIGKYKSSPERFIRSKPSEPALEQTEAYIDAIWEQVIAGIAGDRDLSPEKVKKAIDAIPLLPDEAIEQGFVDEVAYREELDKHIRQKLGANSIVSLAEFQNRRPRQWAGGPEIAVVYVDGSIVNGESGRTPIVDELLSGSDTLGRVLDHLGRDPNVQAVVLRVDSPGGSAVASDLIYRDIRQLAQKKPVVTSMGDIAASGGYYVAAGADQIYATPNTLTGSIGIFSGKFSLGRFFKAVGVNHVNIRRGERADQFGIFEPWSTQQRERVAKSIHYMYRLFLHQAGRTRPLTAEEIDKVGRGRVWAGEAAIEQKLVDHRGGLLAAIRRAEDLAGLPPGRAVYRSYPDTRSFLSLSGGGLSGVAKWLVKVTKGKDAASGHRGSELADTLRGLLEPFTDVLVLPLVYEPGEVLMLPPSPLPVGVD